MSRTVGPMPGPSPRAHGATTLELPTSTPQMVDALRTDRVILERRAILWQRPIRLAVLAAFVASVLALGGDDRARTASMAIAVSVTYIAIVLLTAHAAGRLASPRIAWLPALLVTADIATIAALVRAASPPAGAAMMLVPALLVVQLGAYYHGRVLGTYGAAVAIAAYLAIALALPPWTAGPAESGHHALLVSTLFSMVAATLIVVHAGFRTRINQMRLFCRLIEEGDLSPAFAVGVDRRPDDLTLLAKGLDAMRHRLAEQIGTDPLTGCLNRRALETRLRTEWRQAKRRGTTVAVLAIDIDHFKRVNDTLGHPVGDMALQELAGILKATARDTDAVARQGGDEFVIVLPDTGWQGALTFAERLRRTVEAFAFSIPAGHDPLTISVGVALARGTDPISADVLLHEADRSLYKAKSGGRNRIFA